MAALEPVVVHEVGRLQEQVDAREAMARVSGPLSPYRGAPAFVMRPRPADYDAARQRFGDSLESFAADLREWLTGYRRAADQRSRIFELGLVVTSGGRGAYAEHVSLVIDLPAGVEVVDEWPTVAPPPDRPAYIPPRSPGLIDIPRPEYLGIEMPAVGRPTMPWVTIWQVSADRGRVETGLGAVHHSRSVELDEALMLRAPSVGHYELRWTLYAKKGRRHCTGILELIVPPTPERPPFSKLHGIESFPDVPFIDDDGEVVREARTDDPPARPPDRPVGGSALDRLLESRAHAEWRALGLAYEKEAAAAGDAEADVVNLGRSPGA